MKTAKLAGLTLVFASVLGAATHLKVGDKAPEFTLPATTGDFSSADHLGDKTLVVAFFPAAFTGG